ncbi:MAG: hypothetical protein ACODAJ_08140 [Planctomycetota bacterium]
MAAASLLACQGCTFLRKAWVYTGDRVKDGADMVDVGMTFSGSRSYSAYGCLGSLFSVGGGQIDGYFVGIGGSRVGAFRHYNKTIGLGLYSYEEFGWGDFDRSDPATLDRKHKGLIGWLFFRDSDEEDCEGPT